MKQQIWWVLVGVLLLQQCQGQDHSPWVLKIDGKKVTLKEILSAREGYLALMAQQLQVSPKQLRDYLKNPEKAGRPEMTKMLENLKKELALDNFIEQYKKMALLNQEAKKTGFLKQKQTKERIKFMTTYLVANMYLMEHLQASKIKISDEEAIDACETMRKQDRRLRNVPIEQCLDFARQQLTLKILAEKQQKFMGDIVAAYKIVKNTKVDLELYDEAPFIDKKIQKQETPSK